MIGTIDIGGTKTMVGLVEGGKIRIQHQFPTMIESWQSHLEAVSQILESQCRQHNLSLQKLEGIGVSLPGMVDSFQGVLLFAPYAKWENVPVRDWLIERLGNPRVAVENDVNACAVGEHMLGYAKNIHHFLWITVSTGIGGAIMSHGQLIHGAGQVAGEIGHIKVEYQSPELCSCGQKGCLEAHASGTAITREFVRYLQETPKAQEFCRRENLPLDARGCRALADLGNPGAVKIFEDTARYLGRGLSAAINLLNPEAVFIGGGVGRSLDILLPGIQKVLENETVAPARSTLVRYTGLGYEAAFLGASCLPEFQRRNQL